MNWWIGAFGLIALSAVALVAFGQAGGLRGQRPTDLGLRDGRLKAPSSTRNSVSSQAWLYTGQAAQYARIEPLSFEGSGIDAMTRLGAIVTTTPGARIIEARPDYLSAEFSTRWLKFVDDAEFVVLPGSQKIDLRSASRLGSEDFGVNRARIEAIRARFER
jgi:uncharacterized protein (DUF1499 family)